MHRHIRKLSLYTSNSIKKDYKNVAVEAGFYRGIATSLGDSLFEYGNEENTDSIQKQIVGALQLGERSKAYDMLLNMGHANNNVVRANDFYNILRHCATIPDPLFALETWKVMDEKEITPNNSSCLLMIRALCSGGYLDEALNLINFIGGKYGMNPSLAVYNSLLRACLKMENLDYARKCLDLMAHRISGKNEVTYMQLLKLAVCQKNLSAVHEIWKECSKLYSPCLLSLQIFIQSCARLQDITSACETLQYMVSLVQQGKTSITSTAGGRLYPSRLDIPIPSNNIEQGIISSSAGKEVQSVVLHKINSVSTEMILDSSFRAIVHACEKTRNSRLAEELMLQMQNLGVQPSSYTFNGLIRVLMPAKGISEGMKMLKIMQQRNLKPEDLTLAVLSIGSSKNLQLDLAEALLVEISNCKNPLPFNVFFQACDTMNQPERAVQMWAKMKQLKIQPDIRTYELLFSLFGYVNVPYENGNMLSHADCAKRINAIEMDMARNGVQHSYLSMKNLLKALGAEGMIKELMHYLHKAEELSSRTNIYFGTPIYNLVLHSLVEAQEGHLAIQTFKNMKSSGFRLNAGTYTTMIDCCSIIQCYKSASALLSLMLRDGFYPEAATYTALIKLLLDDGNFNEAMNILDIASSEKIQPDALLYNSILRKASEKGRIDILEFIVEEMHREKIKPDTVTCNSVFSAYVKRGFYRTAWEALQVVSMRMICEEDNALQEKKAEFEDNFILSEDPESESRILKYLGGPKEHIAFALLNLRWCAIAGFEISWSPNETLWARRLSATYDLLKRRTAR